MLVAMLAATIVLRWLAVTKETDRNAISESLISETDITSTLTIDGSHVPCRPEAVRVALCLRLYCRRKHIYGLLLHNCAAGKASDSA